MSEGATVAQSLTKTAENPQIIFFKFIIFNFYFVFQSCGMTYRSISERHFIVLGLQIHTISGIVKNSYLIQSVYQITSANKNLQLRKMCPRG